MEIALPLSQQKNQSQYLRVRMEEECRGCEERDSRATWLLGGWKDEATRARSVTVRALSSHIPRVISPAAMKALLHAQWGFARAGGNRVVCNRRWNSTKRLLRGKRMCRRECSKIKKTIKKLKS